MGNPARPLESTISEVEKPGGGPASMPAGSAPPEKVLPAPQGGTTSLQETARRGGRVIASVQEKVRAVPGLVTDIRGRLIEFRAHARQDAVATAAEWRHTAERKIGEARSRVRRIAEHNPLYLIAGAGIAAFVLGFALRIRRSRNARS